LDQPVTIRSQNVLFLTESRADDPGDPPGNELLGRLVHGLKSGGYQSAPLENWRDCGSSVTIGKYDRAVQIVLSSTNGPNEWIMQIAASQEPGWIARLFGAKRLDLSEDIHRISIAVHRVLAGMGCSQFRWQADGYPDAGRSSAEPVRPS
jgi:hypothetical protein